MLPVCHRSVAVLHLVSFLGLIWYFMLRHRCAHGLGWFKHKKKKHLVWLEKYKFRSRREQMGEIMTSCSLSPQTRLEIVQRSPQKKSRCFKLLPLSQKHGINIWLHSTSVLCHANRQTKKKSLHPLGRGTSWLRVEFNFDQSQKSQSWQQTSVCGWPQTEIIAHILLQVIFKVWLQQMLGHSLELWSLAW